MGANIYWCWDLGHHEDWFVVAMSAGSAKKFFAEYEGMDYGSVRAKMVCQIQGMKEIKEPVHPEHSLIEACGGKILRDDTPREVAFGKKIYREGGMEFEVNLVRDDMFEAKGGGRPNGTARHDMGPTGGPN
jgi:hypothetical protein